jgi:hypothetical protein
MNYQHKWKMRVWSLSAMSSILSQVCFRGAFSSGRTVLYSTPDSMGSLISVGAWKRVISTLAITRLAACVYKALLCTSKDSQKEAPGGSETCKQAGAGRTGVWHNTVESHLPCSRPLRCDLWRRWDVLSLLKNTTTSKEKLIHVRD